MKAKYIVMLVPEGGCEEYIGTASTLAEARKLANRHRRGEVAGTPRSLWDTARASGNPVEGCDYPDDHDDEPVGWAGTESEPYAILRGR